MNKEEIVNVFDEIAAKHVVVIGDVMLDNYWWGNVDRISPEAPVPVVTLKSRESRLGGAANVALNCKSLGAKVTLASVIGNDHEGNTLRELVKDAGIETNLILKSKTRVTTTKTRILSRSQQILRLDDEIKKDLNTEDEHVFIDKVLKFLQVEKPDIVIFEDYNKGVLKANVIQKIIAHCVELGVVTAVDPKEKNFLVYKNVTIFKPNLKEVREGLHVEVEEITLAEMDGVHQLLRQELNHKITFVTLSEHGVYYSNEKSAIIPSHMRRISDVSGAGDTVIATAALIYSATQDEELMAQISNLAGGLVCESLGVVPIDVSRLEEETIKLLVKD